MAKELSKVEKVYFKGKFFGEVPWVILITWGDLGFI